MIIEYPRGRGRANRDAWYTYTYENGIRATLSEYQGDLEDLEDLGRRLSAEKGREVRMRRHLGDEDRLHAIFVSSRKRRRERPPAAHTNLNHYEKLFRNSKRRKSEMGIWTRNCLRCRKGSGEISIVTVHPNSRAETANGSDVADLERLRRSLTQGYTAESLVREVRRSTDPRKVQLVGIRKATEDWVVDEARRLRLRVARADARMIADAVVDRAGAGA